MKFTAQSISRLIFLFFIIGLSVYFMFVNKKLIKEGFADGTTEETNQENLPKDDDALSQVVKDLYGEIWKNDINQNTPSDAAVNFYVDFAKERVLTRDDLRDIIESSAPSLEKTFQPTNSSVVSTDVYGTEDEVTEIYNEILFRNPDENELQSFSKLLKEDKTFNLEKLKQILYASEEYKRLEKTQTNKVYSNLMGGVTDRQLTLIVTDIYNEVVGNSNIDSDTMKFLKKKLLEFNLDETMFKDFLQKYLKNESFQATTKKNEVVSENSSKSTGSQNTVSQKGVSQEEMLQMKQDILKEIKSSFENAPKSKEDGMTVGNEEQTQINPNRQVIEILLRTAKENNKDTYLDSQSVLDRIKDEAKCVFDKNATDDYYKSLGPDNSLAALQDKRNTDDLRNTCIRNQKFLGADEDMVLDPSQKWSVPQKHPPVCVGSKNDYQPTVEQTALIGTLLADAKSTQVGSILPDIPPR